VKFGEPPGPLPPKRDNAVVRWGRASHAASSRCPLAWAEVAASRPVRKRIRRHLSDSDDIETVEVYGMRALFGGALRSWPRFVPCGNPNGSDQQRATSRVGLQYATSSGRRRITSDVAVVVIWLKR
jgi:hypothetical protein